ncbi:MAG: hypothetical protein HC903_00900 [Methylacidiphilales bacterium]|nr:hypothetical protein [Candidatus Methylacidiphilales bacterium]NJR16523.1 hypothetical protein [Calothrix sp. CSU_2_0]
MKYRSILWLNSLCLFTVFGLLAYTKYVNTSAGALFAPPHFPDSPTEGLLTNIFQILCAIPPFICAFSFATLRKINPQNKNNNFILYSALLTLGFLLNEKFRIHIILLTTFGIPKFVTIVVYALIGLCYGVVFKREIIKSTPYILLLVGLGLLISGVLVDLLHLAKSSSTPLEGIPKLFSGINVVLYYWLVCDQEVVNSFK